MIHIMIDIDMHTCHRPPWPAAHASVSTSHGVSLLNNHAPPDHKLTSYDTSRRYKLNRRIAVRAYTGGTMILATKEMVSASDCSRTASGSSAEWHLHRTPK